MLHAVIMAGGAGTRFWPASRADRPKQLLPLAGERSLLQATVDRLAGLAPPERTLIVTNERLTDAVRAQLPELPPGAVLGEPCKRDTAPCIGLAAELLVRREPQAVLAILPADHVIGPDAEFRRALRAAADRVAEDPRRIVVFGIPPTYPAESFGYIERGEPLPEPSGAADGPAAFRVVKFREKPNAETARQFLAAGGFYWNAGIFVLRAETILAALARFEPALRERLRTIGDAAGAADFAAVLAREFAAIRGQSIDYAVLEKYDQTIVLEAPFAWDDVGNWPAVARLHGADEQGNTLQGRCVTVDVRDCVIRAGGGQVVAAVGVEHLIIVQTPDAVLIADRRREESVREVVKLLEARGWTDVL